MIKTNKSLFSEFTEDPERNLERYLQELQNIGELNTKLDMVERQLVLLEVNVPRRQFEIEEVQTNAEFAKQRAGKFKEARLKRLKFDKKFYELNRLKQSFKQFFLTQYFFRTRRNFKIFSKKSTT